MPDYILTLSDGTETRITAESPEAAQAHIEGLSLSGQEPKQAGPQRSMASTLTDYGAIETLGGIGGGLLGSLGGPAGALAGATSGAALMRFLRGMKQGESPTEAALPSLGAGLLESTGPLAARALHRGGTALVRATLPKATGIFTDVGRGNPFAGRQAIAEAVTAAPGLTPRRTFEGAQSAIKGAEQQITRGIRDATRRGTTLDVPRMTRPARQVAMKQVGYNLAQPGGARTAQRLIEHFEHQPTETLLGHQVMSPVQVRRMQKATRYSPFEQSVTKPQMVGALRRGMSTEMKRTIPAVAKPLATESQNIPIRNLMAEMVPGAEAPGARIGMHGGAGLGVPTLVARGAMFGGGKLMERTGRAAPITPAMLRLLMGLASQQGQP